MQDFEAFFDDQYGQVNRAVALVIGNRDRAEEVTQEAFARAFRHWRSVSRMESPAGWVYAVAMNTQRSWWRRENRQVDETRPAISPDRSASVLTAVLVRDAIAQLAPRQRTAIVLRYLSDLSISEIAQAMGCAQGTVKATLHQALRSLQIGFSEDDL